MTGLRLVCLGLLLTGCSVPWMRSLEGRHQAGQLVVRADELVRAGKYREAQEVYRRVLNEDAKTGVGDRALFGLGRLYLVPDNPDRDYRQAYQYFERLPREYPQSQWASEARAWRELLAVLLALRKEVAGAHRVTDLLRREAQEARQEAERVGQDLERLKQLELELERLRR